jgi:hypothetical protein
MFTDFFKIQDITKNTDEQTDEEVGQGIAKEAYGFHALVGVSSFIVQQPEVP